MPFALSSFDGFAWPWLLLAVPLPWMARRLLPSAPSAAAALRVP
jgi:Ca-activated chloride channel family protein